MFPPNLLLSLFFSLFSLPTLTLTQKYLFSFGDSYTDTGFEITGTQPSPSAPLGNPAYGLAESYPYRGDWSGGPNYIDFLTTTYNTSLVLNYNFAYGGATISNSVVPSASNIHTLQQQIENYFAPKYATMGSQAADWNSGNAVFSILIGINDVDASHATTDPAVQIPKLMNAYFTYVGELYNAGARKFLFISVPPVDRSPAFAGTDTANQSQTIDAYNVQLAAEIQSFAAAHADVVASTYDFHAFMTQVLDAPATYGFQDATCSGAGESRCVWWNYTNLHTTSTFQQVLAQDMTGAVGKLGW